MVCYFCTLGERGRPKITNDSKKKLLLYHRNQAIQYPIYTNHLHPTLLTPHTPLSNIYIKTTTPTTTLPTTTLTYTRKERPSNHTSKALPVYY